jgi:hypothetical protein
MLTIWIWRLKVRMATEWLARTGFETWSLEAVCVPENEPGGIQIQSPPSISPDRHKHKGGTIADAPV